ncbi:MAG: 4Fe-4S dicluster domain-containing protein [Deltaproteobacteria bacterium]|nr:4Fe-4S dicluster domain-containing protein [Deltaproteobacteria bacterium]
MNLWHLGRKESVPLNAARQIAFLVRSMASQRLLAEKKFIGIMHLMVFYGFLVLVLGTVLLMLDTHLNLHLLTESKFVLFKITLNTLGLGALLGVSGLIARRYFLKQAADPNTIDTLVTLLFPWLILVTGFIVQGGRIAADPAGNPGWELWAYPSYPVVALLRGRAGVFVTHTFIWWFHMLLAFAAMSALLWLKLSHIVVAPLNIFWEGGRDLRGQPREINLAEKNFGVSKKEDFTYHQLMSLDACVGAGRCEILCPAYNSGKPLSPREINEKIMKVKDLREPLAMRTVVDEIWCCTTCGACQQKCPTMADSMDKIIDLRRYRVMVEGKMPESFKLPLASTQKRGHPWSGANVIRTEWTKGLEVPLASDKKEFDVLFWVGCTGALVERNMEVSRAMARVFISAGVDFAILGQEESCTGHMARRVGNEYLYQIMARKNIAKLNQYRFNRIVTACPHCYNTLKTEYGVMGAHYQVISHVEFIAGLIKEKRLDLKPDRLEMKLTYHDPCYLGRLNGIMEAPRYLISQLDGKYREMVFSGSDSFCCGGGGGGIWMEDNTGRRINGLRVYQALETGAEVIGVACPFCLQMLESGLTSSGHSEVRVCDLVELVAGQLSENSRGCCGFNHGGQISKQGGK